MRAGGEERRTEKKRVVERRKGEVPSPLCVREGRGAGGEERRTEKKTISHSVREARLCSQIVVLQQQVNLSGLVELKIQRNEDICRGLRFVLEQKMRGARAPVKFCPLATLFSFLPLSPGFDGEM